MDQGDFENDPKNHITILRRFCVRIPFDQMLDDAKKKINDAMQCMYAVEYGLVKSQT